MTIHHYTSTQATCCSISVGWKTKTKRKNKLPFAKIQNAICFFLFSFHFCLERWVLLKQQMLFESTFWYEKNQDYIIKILKCILFWKLTVLIFSQRFQEINHLFLYSGILLYTEDLIAWTSLLFIHRHFYKIFIRNCWL